jgi:hypothetical protein
MIDLKMLFLIDTRLWAICLQNNQLFDGVNILLCGDFYQLPPMSGQPLYLLQLQNIDAIKGLYLY